MKSSPLAPNTTVLAKQRREASRGLLCLSKIIIRRIEAAF